MLRFIVTLMLFSSVAFASEWKQTSDMDDVKVWMLKSNPDVTAAFQTSIPKEKIDWSKVDKENFFKKFESDKKRSLGIVGIKEWKATNYKWTKTQDGFELVVEGTYLDPSQQKTSFKETQFYKSQKTYQILNTWPTSVKDGQKLADEFVSNLKKENKDL